MPKKKCSKMDYLIKKALELKKYKEKYTHYNNLSNTTFIGKFFYNKRDFYFEKYSYLRSQINTEFLQYLDDDDYEFETIPI